MKLSLINLGITGCLLFLLANCVPVTPYPAHPSVSPTPDRKDEEKIVFVSDRMGIMKHIARTTDRNKRT
jgi:hypothetical protein